MLTLRERKVQRQISKRIKKGEDMYDIIQEYVWGLRIKGKIY